MADDPMLRRGPYWEAAIETLTRLASGAGNVVSEAQASSARQRYLLWVEQAEGQLRDLFVSPAVWSELYTDRYWRIHEMELGPGRPLPLITNEARWQRERIQALADRLRSTLEAFQIPADCLAVVPDTNVLVHHRRYNEIDWPKHAGARQVRLVVPLVVIDELDALSYKSRDTNRRARELLRALQQARGLAGPHTPVEVRPNVTLQLLIDPPGHARRENNDDEILDRVQYLAAVTSDHVAVATGDYGMRLRAEARGLKYIELPDETRL